MPLNKETKPYKLNLSPWKKICAKLGVDLYGSFKIPESHYPVEHYT